MQPQHSSSISRITATVGPYETGNVGTRPNDSELSPNEERPTEPPLLRRSESAEAVARLENSSETASSLSDVSNAMAAKGSDMVH